MKSPRVSGLTDRLSIDGVSDPALHRYLSLRRNWLAALIAVTMVAVCWPVLGDTSRLPAFLLPVVAILGCGGLALIFAGPDAVRAGWAVTVIVAAGASLVPNEGPWPMPIPLFLSLLAMTVAALMTQPLDRLPIVAVATAGAFVVGMPAGVVVGWTFALVVVALGIAFFRYRVRSQREIAEQVEETEVLRAREAVLAERARIARDLHDIVAHRMSMVVVMAQTAPYRLAAGEPPETLGPGATAELTGIADAARESLDEVRALLGVLRPHSDDAVELAPVPGIGEVAGLLDEVRAIGVSIDFDDESDHASIGPTVGAAVYRIVQESVTNATRHAPGAPVDVRLTPEADPDGPNPDGPAPDGGAAAGRPARLRVTIVNGPSTGAAEASRSGGHGILGMTERALAVGGSLTAAPTPAGGFAVQARLPLSAGQA